MKEKADTIKDIIEQLWLDCNNIPDDGTIYDPIGKLQDQAVEAVKDRVKERGLSEGEIMDKIINSKIVNYAKKLGRYVARLERKEYDDPEDKWLKDKSTELGKAIHTEMDKAVEGL